MKHFAAEEWADFARGLVEKDRKSIMQSHLQTGCRECNKQAQFWQHVHSVARRQASVGAPEGSVAIAKAMFGQKAVFKPRAKATIADLLFDSFQRPLLAGVRSAVTAPRQLLYGTGTHRIDVRLEPQPDSEKVSVVGQVLDSAEPGRGLQGMMVLLLAGDRVMAQSETNRFGEFDMQAVLADKLELLVRLPAGREVRAALVQPDETAAREAAHATNSNRVRKGSGKSNNSTRKKG